MPLVDENRKGADELGREEGVYRRGEGQEENEEEGKEEEDKDEEKQEGLSD